MGSPDNEFHSSVGALIGAFADVEDRLRLCLRELSGLPQNKFEILVGFPRTGESLSKLKKLLALAHLEGDGHARVQEALNQLENIVKLRDRLVHYGGFAEEEVVAVYLKPNGVPQNVRWFAEEYPPSSIRDAASDLGTIYTTLTAYIGSRPPEEIRNEMKRELPKLGTWQYKPPEQQTVRR
ncbi:hypothetical protein GCM10022276_27580 [Sphingomonas limnosediminicola]|uniref:HEPN AbiU2-like domain-containing protein n=1 Tax=Sphingomonas limnosediminicola TaxID=940133 RepID=A0ABP7LU05_9SPHN